MGATVGFWVGEDVGSDNGAAVGFAVFTTTTQSWFESDGGTPRGTLELPPTMLATLPVCKPPPLRGSNQRTENVAAPMPERSSDDCAVALER